MLLGATEANFRFCTGGLRLFAGRLPAGSIARLCESGSINACCVRERPEPSSRPARLGDSRNITPYNPEVRQRYLRACKLLNLGPACGPPSTAD